MGRIANAVLYASYYNEGLAKLSMGPEVPNLTNRTDPLSRVANSRLDFRPRVRRNEGSQLRSLNLTFQFGSPSQTCAITRTRTRNWKALLLRSFNVPGIIGAIAQHLN